MGLCMGEEVPRRRPEAGHPKMVITAMFAFGGSFRKEKEDGLSLWGCSLEQVNEFKLALRGSLAQVALHGHHDRRKLFCWAAEGRGR